MKKLRILLTLVIMGIIFMVSDRSCYAVPALNGSSEDEEGRCHSSTADTPVTLEVLEKRDRMKEAKNAPGSNTITALSGSNKKDKKKTLPLLCIVVGFAGETSDAPEGLPYSDEYDWYDFIFNGDESLVEYYNDMSSGKFTFEPAAENSRYGTGGNTNLYDKKNDGIVHVTVDFPHLDWSVLPKITSESTYPVYSEAVRKASSYVDLAQYDVDGNGEISNSELAVTFIFAGYDTAVEYPTLSRGIQNYIWPHASTFTEMKEDLEDFEYPSIDGVRFDRYICMAETDVFKGVDQQALLSTLFHELGHYLGLPDLYNSDTETDGEWRNYRVGCMSLMADGCWGVRPDGSFRPYSMDVWSMYYLGWLDAVPITESGTYTVSGDKSSADPPKPALYYLSGAKKGEYYLIENRLMTGWDEGLYVGIAAHMPSKIYPAVGGMVIWHVDTNDLDSRLIQNTVNVLYRRPGVMPLYPELNKDGTYSLISDKKDGGVLLDPIIDGSNFGQKKADLMLPCFGWGKNVDKRSSRFTSKTRIYDIGRGGDSITFKVSIQSNKWVKENGSWRYLGNNGIIQTDWLKYQNKWYYLGENGIMKTGWQTYRGKWYFLAQSGEMKTGWVKSGNKWYYLDQSGAMNTGWLKWSGKWYYFGIDGAMKTGWQKWAGKWYYFTSAGVMKTGWLNWGNCWYFLDSNGVMVTGTRTIGGKTYRFYYSGVCLNP